MTIFRPMLAGFLSATGQSWRLMPANRPSLPLITAFVVSVMLIRHVILLTAGDATASQAGMVPEPAASTVLAASDARTPLTSVAMLDVEPAAGPEETMSVLESASDTPVRASPIMTVEGLEDVARDLVERRQKLEQRETGLQLMEQALSADRRDLEAEIGRLEALRDEISSMIVQLDDQEEERLQQLVKVYETMKAKRAAAIFDRLDMPVLIPVAKRMRESKLASVMAAMNPAKAELVTSELAREHGLPQMR